MLGKSGLACSFADPGVLFCPLLHSAPLPIPVPPAAAGGKGRQPPSSLYQPPGYLIRFWRSVADFLPRFPPFPSLPYLSTSHRCQTTMTDVPRSGAAPHRPGGERKAAGTLRDGTRAALGCHGAQPGRGSSRGADPFHGSCRVPAATRCRDVPEPRGRAQRQQAARSQGRAGGGEGMASRRWDGRMGERTGAFMGPRRGPYGAAEPMGAGAVPGTAPTVAPGVAPAAGQTLPPPPPRGSARRDEKPPPQH